MYKLHIFGGLSCDPFTPVALKCGVRLQTTFWGENIKVKFGLTGVSLESKIFLIFYDLQRAGQLDEDEIRRMETIMLNPRQYKIPDWFLNRQKDCKDGTYAQTISNGLDTKLREDLERMKKVKFFTFDKNNLKTRLPCIRLFLFWVSVV